MGEKTVREEVLILLREKGSLTINEIRELLKTEKTHEAVRLELQLLYNYGLVGRHRLTTPGKQGWEWLWFIKELPSRRLEETELKYNRLLNFLCYDDPTSDEAKALAPEQRLELEFELAKAMDKVDSKLLEMVLDNAVTIEETERLGKLIKKMRKPHIEPEPTPQIEEGSK